MLDIEHIRAKELLDKDALIFGVPTWNDGELPYYWDEFIPDLEDIDLAGKKVAIYGGGDQLKYPENFVDGIGIMAAILEACGATVVGHTSADGFDFECSKAYVDGHFLGLPVDYENKGNLVDEQLKNWVTQLKKEFNAK